jgi:hypothetical protein
MFIEVGTLSPLYVNGVRVETLPRYNNMTAGHFVTHVVGPCFGYEPDANGDLKMFKFIVNGRVVFGADDRNRFIRHVIPEGSRLNMTLNIGGPAESANYAHGDPSAFPAEELA